MSRKPSVRYFESRSAYYCQHKGKQHRLGDGPDDGPNGPNYKKAFDTWVDLIRLEHAENLKDRNTFRVVAELYLQHIESRRREGTFALRKRYLTIVCEKFGETLVCDLTSYSVLAWVDAMRGKKGKTNWGDASVSICLVSMHSALKWAVKVGLIGKNPIGGIELPGRRSRGAEAMLSDNERALVLESASKWLRPLLTVMDETGCRPGEAAAMTAAHFDPRINAMVFQAEASRREGDFAHKTAKKGKVRRIYLTGVALETVRQQMAKFPRGPIFRSRHGKQWRSMNIAVVVRLIRKKLKMSHLTPYSFRHTYATRWIMSGRSIELLASLLGNSPQTIRMHYNHVIEDEIGMQSIAEAFSSERKKAAASGETQPSAVPFREQSA